MVLFFLMMYHLLKVVDVFYISFLYVVVFCFFWWRSEEENVVSAWRLHVCWWFYRCCDVYSDEYDACFCDCCIIRFVYSCSEDTERLSRSSF